MVKQTAGATIGGGCLMMFLCCGGCQLIGLFAPRPKPIPVLTATDTEMPEETATVAIDATSPQETTVDTVAIEKIFNEEMIAYEQAVADYENAVALKEAATKDLAETIAELASHNESRPTPVTHSARKWRTLIGDHETLATYVESDKDSVKLLKPGTAEPISVPIENWSPKIACLSRV